MHPYRLRSTIIRTTLYPFTNISSKSTTQYLFLTYTNPSTFCRLHSPISSFCRFYSSSSPLFITYSERLRRKRLRMNDSLVTSSSSSSGSTGESNVTTKPYLLSYPDASFWEFSATVTPLFLSSALASSSSSSSTNINSTTVDNSTTVTSSTGTPKLHGYEWYCSIGSPRYIVAPMVDQSELVFRLLCREYGAQCVYTPMLHSRLMVEKMYHMQRNFSTTLSERPVIAQLCGNDPSLVLDAAKKLEPYVNAVDLNLGCPQGIAKKGNYGAFLLDDPDTIIAIVETLHQKLQVPVTCKIRILNTLEKTVNFAKRLEKAGCSLLTVHGRERHENKLLVKYANWDVIKAIKSALTIPVFANGSIGCYADIQSCLDYTGCDGVMSSEALLENAGLFSNNVPDKVIQEQHNQGFINKVTNDYYYPIDYTVKEVSNPKKRSSKSSTQNNNSTLLSNQSAVPEEEEKSKDDNNDGTDDHDSLNKRRRVDTDSVKENNIGSPISSSTVTLLSSSSSSLSHTHTTTATIKTPTIITSFPPDATILPPSLASPILPSSSSLLSSSFATTSSLPTKLYRPLQNNQLDIAYRYLQLYDLYGTDTDFVNAKAHIFKFLFGFLRIYHDIRDLIHHTHEYKNLNTFKKCVEELQHRFRKDWYPQLYEVDPCTGELVYKREYQQQLHILYQEWEKNKELHPNLAYCTPEYLIDPSQPGAWYMRYRTEAYGGRKPPYTESYRTNNKVPKPQPLENIFTSISNNDDSILSNGTTTNDTGTTTTTV